MAAEGELSSVEGAIPQRLARVLEDSASAHSSWRPQELGAILRHQLSVPLAFDLGALEAVQWPELAGSRLMWAVTFESLLHHPDPSIMMLQHVKAFAKRCRQDANGPLPPEVATVLYFASIIAARLHARQSISDLDEPRLRAGLQWVLAQPWIDEQTRKLFEAGLTSLEPGGA